MNFKEALKAAIDGKEVTHAMWDFEHKLIYRNGGFVLLLYASAPVRLTEYGQAVIDNMEKSDGWVIFKRQPKYRLGQIVYNEQGDIAKIVNFNEETFDYYLQFNERQTENVVRYKEDKIAGAVEW